jgi:hypothetical protein
MVKFLGVYGYKPKQIIDALNKLAAWSLVIFKRHLGAYAIYAGSDFDINEALSQALEISRKLIFARFVSQRPFIQ